VRSAYHLNMQLLHTREDKACSSSSTDEHKGWLALWDSDVPGKAKIHVWRLIKNGLAVGDELQRRRIKEGIKCIVCNRDESLLPILALSSLGGNMGSSKGGNWSAMCSPNSLVRRHSDLHGWVLD
jgi:hypothetical protein